VAGHATGEMVLGQVAERLVQAAPTEGIWGNYWGDKFFLALPLLQDKEQLRRITHQLLDVCEYPWVVGMQEFFLSFSTGAAMFPEHGTTAEQLMKNAHFALSQAKKQGKGRYRLYHSDLSIKMNEMLRIEDSLRQTLAQQKQELFFHFQPRIDLKSGGINSFEALLRWHSSELGLLQPGQFIPIAESCGLIGKIDQWVLENACRQISEWLATGYQTCIAINLSAGQFYSGLLLPLILETLEKYRIQPWQLELEITESMVMQDFSRAADTIKQLKSLGLGIALDDFGSGYSSLKSLWELPIDRLKVDQSFIREMELAPQNKAMLQAIIDMGHLLKLKVTAEGVETPEQLAALVQYGCDEVQGYYFARPMSARNVCNLLRQGNENINRFCETLAMGSSFL
ncbi:MAG TPA: bifunctional diguanylate cyclase/phosphodiesterase, partial [Negativicutes bacterium]|nr:bifunctional diguanylate cyclase/phosphodiesterase [Negativicutes bacterium]